MKEIYEGEVWFVEFPFDDDPTKFSNRPVVVLDTDNLNVLSVKVTKHDAREEDDYDTPVIYWKEAKLHFASTARISKVINLNRNNFIHKIGDLDKKDLDKIADAYICFMDGVKNQNKK